MSLADANTITVAITDGRSRNEQYQGLELAKLCWPRMSPADRNEIRNAIGTIELVPQSDRWLLAQQVLDLPNS